MTFGKYEDAAATAEFDRRTETGNAAADHQKVGRGRGKQPRCSHTLFPGRTRRLTRQRLATLRPEGDVTLHPHEKNGCGSHPLEAGMATIAHARILGVFFPRPRPMYVYVDVVVVDHDPFNAEVHDDVMKIFEIR